MPWLIVVLGSIPAANIEEWSIAKEGKGEHPHK